MDLVQQPTIIVFSEYTYVAPYLILLFKIVIVQYIVMYEVELMSFVDHDAADAYAGFTKVSVASSVVNIVRMYPMATGGERDGIGQSTNRGC